MQFQAELNLLDSFNESLRQVMDVEKSLNDVKKDEDKISFEQKNLENKFTSKDWVVGSNDKQQSALDLGKIDGTFSSNCK